MLERPDSSLGVFHPLEDVVKGEVVSHGVLPAVGVVPVEGKGGGKPIVNLIEIHLFVWRL